MLNRSMLIRLSIDALDYFYTPLRKVVLLSNRYLQRVLKKINAQEFVFFRKGDDVAILNKEIQYVQENETTRKLKIVNIKELGENNNLLKIDIEVLDRAYPEFSIEFIELDGEFGPK